MKLSDEIRKHPGDKTEWDAHHIADEVAKLEEKLQKCEDDFEECAGVGMQLDLESAALEHKLGLCEMALRVVHLPLPLYDDEQESGG